MKRDLEQADKFEEEPVSKDIDLKNIESSSIDSHHERGVDPDSGEDKSQSYFANQFIKKILEMHERKDFFEMIEEEGPVIKYNDNGRKETYTSFRYGFTTRKICYI